MKRVHLVKLHLIISGIVAPLALVYFVAGAIYTLGGSGSVNKVSYSLPALDIRNTQSIIDTTREILLNESIDLPETKPRIKYHQEKGLKIRWNRLSQSVVFEQTIGADHSSVTVRNRSILTMLMRIHRGEAGMLFRLMSIVLVSGLVLTMLAGVILAFSITTYRQLVTRSMMVGLLIPLLFIAITY